MGSKKVVRQTEIAHTAKKPSRVEDPEGYLKKHPIWAFQQCDLNSEKWSLKQCGSFFDDILTKLISYEGMTWADIFFEINR